MGRRWRLMGKEGVTLVAVSAGGKAMWRTIGGGAAAVAAGAVLAPVLPVWPRTEYVLLGSNVTDLVTGQPYQHFRYEQQTVRAAFWGSDYHRDVTDWFNRLRGTE
jgi:hypothetical protein